MTPLIPSFTKCIMEVDARLFFPSSKLCGPLQDDLGHGLPYESIKLRTFRTERRVLTWGAKARTIAAKAQAVGVHKSIVNTSRSSYQKSRDHFRRSLHSLPLIAGWRCPSA